MIALNLYKLATNLSLPLLVAGFVWRSKSQKDYRQRLNERLGFLGHTQPGGIVIHAASVGEVIALKPFIEMTLAHFTNTPVTITTFTPTGSARVTETFGDRVQHYYLPIDAPSTVKKFLKSLKPKVLVLMETELWPTLIEQCGKLGVSTMLINGRISQRSFPRYQKITPLISPTLETIDSIMTQSEDDAQRFLALGAPGTRVSCTGNIKYDIDIPDQSSALHAELRMIALQRKTWVVGSSHADEEALFLASFKQLQKHIDNLILIIAPRHPERVKHLVELADSMGLSVVKRSEQTRPSKNDDIWLIDTMGELLNFYQIADVCTVAGSFGATGGHNPIEAAMFKKPIIVGTNMDNFQEITTELLNAEGVVQLPENMIEILCDEVIRLFNEDETAKTLGNKAYSVIEANQGATRTAFEKLVTLYEGREE